MNDSTVPSPPPKMVRFHLRSAVSSCSSTRLLMQLYRLQLKTMHSCGFSMQATSQPQQDAEVLQEQLLKAKYGGLLPKKKLAPRDHK